MPADADSVLKDLLDLGLSAVELRSQPVEQFFGAPVIPASGRNATPEQRAAQQAAAEATPEVAPGRTHVEVQGVPQEVRGRRRAHSDREVRRCGFHVRRCRRLRLQSCQGTWRARHLLRDSRQQDEMVRPVRRQAQDDGGLSRPHQHHQPRGFRPPRELGDRHVVFQVQRHQPRHWALRRGQQQVAGRVPEEIRGPHHPYSPEGPQDQQRPERRLGPGRHSHQGSAPVDEERKVPVPGHHRIRVHGAAKAPTR